MIVSEKSPDVTDDVKPVELTENQMYKEAG